MHKRERARDLEGDAFSIQSNLSFVKSVDNRIRVNGSNFTEPLNAQKDFYVI